MRHYAPLLLLVLSACVSSGGIEQLRAKNPAATDFNGALAKEYLAYAESLAEEGHPIRMQRMVEKGLLAAEGKHVPPSESDELVHERRSLMAALTPDIKDVAYAKAARAQVMFDCCAEGKNLCKESFEATLADLEFIADALVHESDNQFETSFEPGQTTLTSSALGVIDVVAGKAAKLGDYRIELIAYANRPGVNRKVKALANNRLLAVERALIARGVNAGRIHRHSAAGTKEVVLSIDLKEGQNDIAISIQTFGQSEEVRTP